MTEVTEELNIVALVHTSYTHVKSEVKHLKLVEIRLTSLHVLKYGQCSFKNICLILIFPYAS